MLNPIVAKFIKDFGLDNDPQPYNIDNHRKLCDSLSALNGEPENIASITHLSIPGPIGDIPIHVFTPEGTGPFPVILHFPTGGFVGGGMGGSASMCQNLAARAHCVVVLVDFHKAPEFPFPAAPNDAYAALQWIAKNGAKLNVDSTRIAVSGDSAGANLATNICIRARNENGPKILLQVLLVPYIDLAMSTDSVKTIKVLPANSYAYLEWLNKRYLPENIHPRDPKASPFWESNLHNLPEAIVVTTEYDTHVDQGQIYAKRLKAAGNKVTYKNYEDMIHIFLNMESLLPLAKTANKELAQQIKLSLQGESLRECCSIN